MEPNLSNERLGLSEAWPLLTIGMGSLVFVAVVTTLMILICVIFPPRRHRVPVDEQQHLQHDAAH